MMAAGQKPVKALWIRLTPTNTLNQTKPGWTQVVRINESSNMQPATILTQLSTVMAFLPIYFRYC